MSLTLTKSNNTFDNIELVEEVDKSKLKNFIANYEKLNVYTDKKEGEKKLKILNRYYKKIKNNKVLVKYNRKIKYGRSYADKSLSLQGIKKEVRQYLAYDNYVDIDMTNAHPTILLQVLNKNMMVCPNIEKYVNEREQVLRTIMDSDNKTRDEAKTLMITLMYGAKYTGNNQYLKDFKGEVDKVASLIFNSNQDLHNEILKDKKKDKVKTKKYMENKENALLSYFLQEYENKILESAYNYITLNISNENKNVITLCFDGIMIKREENINLIELEQQVYKDTGFNMKFEYKAMEDTYTQKLNNLTDKVDTIPEQYLEGFNHSYCSSLSNYKSKKYYFEMFVSRVFTPQPLYIFKDKVENKCIFYKETELRQSFKQIKSGMMSDAGKEIKFIDYWLDDEESYMYRKADFLPFNDEEEKVDIKEDIYNLFFGYDKRIHTEYNKTMRNKLIQPFLDLGKELCEGKQENFDYLLKYLANMIREPMYRPAIAIIIKSKQGEGKGTFLKAIRNIIGKEHYISSAKPQDFFGNHSELFVNKLLVNPDECEGKDTFDFQGKMKAFISEDKISVNPKCIRPYEVNNFSRLIITTNKPNPINIDFSSKDRRYVVFEASGEYLQKKYNANFWSKLHKHFDRPDFIAALYDYLMEIDYSQINWIRDRPMTQIYYDMARNSLPQEVLFLEHYIEKLSENKGEILNLDFSQFYIEYKSFCDTFGFINNVYNKKVLSMKIVELKCGIERVREGNGIKFVINVDKLTAYMSYVLDNENQEEDNEVVEEISDDYFCM